MVKKLIFEIVAILLVLLAGFYALESQYSNYLTPFDVKFTKLEKNLSQIEQLSIGASHADALKNYGIDECANVFNISFGGQDIFHVKVILEKYLTMMPNLNTIVYVLDYEQMGYNFSTENQEWKDRQYFPYTNKLYEDTKLQRFLTQSNFYRANRDMGFLFDKTKQRTFEMILSDHNTFRSTAAIPLKTSMSSLACKKRAIELSVVKWDEKLITENAGYVEEIIKLCHSYDIKLILLNTPKATCFYKYFNAETERLGKDRINEICASQNTHYFDYYGDISFESYFQDPDHLNDQGAKFLIQRLREDINKIKSR
jgi:hypothetical protein